MTTTATLTETAATANARSRMATVQDLAVSYGPTMDPQTDAANHALLATMQARVVAWVAWDAATDDNKAARRNANRVVAAAAITAGVVSSVACGLHGVTLDGRAFQVVSTDSGRDYLRGVEYAANGREVEGPEVTEVLRFFPGTSAGAQDARDLARRVQAGLV